MKTYESNNLRLKSAQAVSDKLEVMRDRATYESTVTDSLKIQKKFENNYNFLKILPSVAILQNIFPSANFFIENSAVG